MFTFEDKRNAMEHAPNISALDTMQFGDNPHLTRKNRDSSGCDGQLVKDITRFLSFRQLSDIIPLAFESVYYEQPVGTGDIPTFGIMVKVCSLYKL